VFPKELLLDMKAEHTTHCQGHPTLLMATVYTSRVSAESKHPGFRNHLISLLLNCQGENYHCFEMVVQTSSFRADLKTSFLFVTSTTEILFILFYVLQKFIT
jgi:hypothetical protein